MAKAPAVASSEFSNPTWLYKDGVGRLFETGETVPSSDDGWMDHFDADPAEQAAADAASQREEA